MGKEIRYYKKIRKKRKGKIKKIALVSGKEGEIWSLFFITGMLAYQVGCFFIKITRVCDGICRTYSCVLKESFFTEVIIIHIK